MEKLEKLEVKAANQLNDGKDEEHMRCRLQKKALVLVSKRNFTALWVTNCEDLKHNI